MDTWYVGTWQSGEDPARLTVFRREGEALSKVQSVDLPGNFSFLKLDAPNRLLYVLTNGDPEVCQGCGGVLRIYTVQPDGSLVLKQKSSTYGAEPIELALPDRYIAVVNHGSTTNRVCRTERQADGSRKPVWVYDEASLVLIERLPDGGAGKLLDWQEFTGHGDVPFFQESAAPHSLTYSKENRLLLIPERGSERTSLFSLRDGRLLPEGQLPEQKTYGPRNAAMTRDGRHIYVMDEIIPSVTHYVSPAWQAVQRVRTVSREAAGTCDADPRLFTAPHPVALWLSEDERFLYTLTRSTETLSAFSRDADSGNLTMIQEYRLPGTNPRQALTIDGGLYIVLMDTQNLAQVELDKRTGKVLGTKIILDGIPAIAAVDGM